MGVWADIRGCTNCDLHKYMICQPVPGFTKNPNPDVMLIGEAPGADECLIEKPFQGMAGKLLNKLLIGAGIERDNIYVTNLVKCRPSLDNKNKKNRPPTKFEISKCCHLLHKELCLIKPKVVITLGLLPTKELLYEQIRNPKMDDVCGQKFTLSRHKFGESEDFLFDVYPLYHPSALLQYSRAKLDFCQDVLTRLRKEYEFCKW